MKQQNNSRKNHLFDKGADGIDLHISYAASHTPSPIGECECAPPAFRGVFQFVGYVLEEIMLQHFGGSEDEVGIQMRSRQQFVHVAPVAVHLFGEPTDSPPFKVQFVLDYRADMNAFFRFQR